METNGTKPCAFDHNPIIMNLNLADTTEDPRYAVVILKKPSKEQIVQYNEKTKMQQIQINATTLQDENDILPAMYWLFDQLAYKISSKPFNSECIDENDERLTDIGDENLSRIHSTIKIKCIQALHDVSFELVKDEEVDEIFSGGVVKGVLKFNNGLAPDVKMTFRDPSESQRKRFNSVWISQKVGGSRQGKVRSFTNIKVADELFNQTVTNIENATVGGEYFDGYDEFKKKRFLEAIDPSYKLTCLLSVMNRVNANVGK